MKYTIKYFRDDMPEWKKRKDPVICRLFYRPISFAIASLCANVGITANTVSRFSILVALLSAVLFLYGTRTSNILAACFLNIWLVLDCVDGNLARSVQSQPFGEFVDAISGYILNGVICIAMGMAVFETGGVLFTKNNAWILFLGGLASIADPLMRLVYHKYKATVREMNNRGIKIIENDYHDDHSQVTSIKARIEESLGFGGVLPVAVLIMATINCLDLAVIYCSLYYGGACIVICLQYILKAKKYEKINKMQW